MDVAADQIIIRDATIDDAAQIAELVTELGYETSAPAMSARLTSIFGSPDYTTVVAVRDSAVLGVAGATIDRYYERDGRYARIAILVVSAAARGSGIGRRLVETVERWAAMREAREMFVNSGLQRVDAHDFYTRCGYARTGVRFVKRLDGTT
jgi:GNAT superfamily N-acetyltransferase